MLPSNGVNARARFMKRIPLFVAETLPLLYAVSQRSQQNWQNKQRRRHVRRGRPLTYTTLILNF